MCLFEVGSKRCSQNDVPSASILDTPGVPGNGDAFPKHRLVEYAAGAARWLAAEPQDHCQRDVRIGLPHVRALGAGS